MSSPLPAGCPKRMRFGPCGGVRPDGGCEVPPGPCVFGEPVAWPDPPVTAPPATAPLVLTDFSSAPFDRAELARTAGLLAGTCDAVLVGEHQDRPDFPPTLMAQLLGDAGLRPWITLACRDRNRVVLEQELRGLRSVGADTVLCVTGDARAYDVRPGVTQVFDLDGTRLAALAASLGLRAAVAEAPAAPPVPGRPYRLVQKQRAGAAVAVLNHVPSTALLSTFMARALAAGLTLPVIAAVAVYTDAASADALRRLPGLGIDERAVREVLSARDPVAAGIAAAVDRARALLAVPGIAGVNLSGLGSPAGPHAGAEVKAEIGRRIRAERGST